jgi:hypothetical protein
LFYLCIGVGCLEEVVSGGYFDISPRILTWRSELLFYMKGMGKIQLPSLRITLKVWYTVTHGTFYLL